MLAAKENILRVLRHETPERVPFQLEGVLTLFHRDALFYQHNGKPELDEWVDAWGVRFRVSDELNEDSAYPVTHPLKSLDNLAGFAFPDPRDPGLLDDVQRQLDSVCRNDYLLAGMNPAIMFVRAWLLLGMNELLMATILEPGKLTALLDRIADYQVEIAHRYLELGIDIAHMGDDIGTTKALFMRPETWRALIKPRLRRVIDAYKQSGCLIYLHSCGRIMDLVDDFIELGVDILNPLQADANDLTEIRKKTKGKMSLHGGISCDTIMRGSTEEISAVTLATMRLLGAEGEYIADADQGLPFPPDNIGAVEKTVRQHGRYPLKDG